MSQRNDHTRIGSDADRSADFFERMKAFGDEVPLAQREEILKKVTAVLNYKPKVGVFGKTGVGKSSLCNALFGKETAKVSHVSAGTREPQHILLSLTQSGDGITLIDVPGVGESRERDVEYKGLYRRLLPELDLVLWVVKGDDRAMSVDETFYHDVVKPELDKTSAEILFVVNQVDAIQPLREWDVQNRQPGPNQQANIELKRADVAKAFDVHPSDVATVAAAENYNLVDLVDRMIVALPDAKKWGFLRETKAETRSEKARQETEKGFWSTVKDIATDVLKMVVPAVVTAVATKVASFFNPLRWF
ncbi:GTPase family protein [Burkholderia cenocepacia]|uniref:GTPase family protein n=1 Tax=Burkholderia cenocepacia TaxID=95486 RepID=UPI00265478CC|nr:GTPase [Burkholderia cenocepacia]MDN7542593.1 50S ribosome-binding GTPase [Burkholderia cenocepacia]